MDDATRRRRRHGHYEFAWIFVALCWSGLRIWFVGANLRRYGVDVRVYAAVDLCSTIPYAIGASRTVRHLAARRPSMASRWLALTIVCFLLPDLVILFSANGLPLWVYALIGSVLTVGAVLAVRNGRRRLDEVRLARQEA